MNSSGITVPPLTEVSSRDEKGVADVGRADNVDEALDSSKDTSKDSSKGASPCPSLREPGEKIIVTFQPRELDNPYNFSKKKKIYIVLTCMLLVMNSTIGSSIATGAADFIAEEWNITNQAYLVLPTSIYLIGYVLGPLVFAPLSETYGRKMVMLSTFVVFTAFTLGAALAPNFAALIIMRLLTGIGASTPISVIGGIYADIYNTPKARGLAITMFMAGTTWGPLIGPVASGYVSPHGWRWSFWVSLIIAGATWPPLLLMPETYGPALLRKKAQARRKETGDDRYVAQSEVEKQDLRELLVVVCTRPVRMFFQEAIVLFSCLYLSLIYGIFYIYFQAYSLIFGGTYGFSEGQVGLAFLPIGLGAIIACGMYLYWDHRVEAAQNRSPPPRWSQQEEYRRLPLACVGGPLFVISIFWVGWSAREDVHWIVPILGSLPFGVGFLLIFMALINYIVDAYEVFAASGMGAASCSRSLFGVVLPFSTRPLYERLGVAWGCSLLGFLSMAMCVIPFVFIKSGDRIRANSKFCQYLKQKKEEQEQKDRGDRAGLEREKDDEQV